MVYRRFRVIRQPADSLVHNWDLVQPVLSEYAQKLQRTIIVSNHYGEVEEPKTKPGTLHIYINSVPDDTDFIDLTHAYGLELEQDQTDALLPSSPDDVIYDFNQTAVAQVVGGTLYVLFDLLGGDNARALMKRLMASYFDFQLAGNQEDRARIKDEQYLELVSQSRNRLEEHLLLGAKRTVRDIYMTITDYDESIRQHQRAIVDDLLGRKRKLREMRQFDRPTQPIDVDAMLDQLKDLSPTRSVIVTSHYILIDVGQVDIVRGEMTYDVGEFELYLYPDGSNGGARVVNKTRTVMSMFNSHYYHPHVTADGYCCLGNISDAIPKLLAEGDFVMAATLMIKYIRTTNSEDTLCPIERWPFKVT